MTCGDIPTEERYDSDLFFPAAVGIPLHTTTQPQSPLSFGLTLVKGRESKTLKKGANNSILHVCDMQSNIKEK